MSLKNLLLGGILLCAVPAMASAQQTTTVTTQPGQQATVSTDASGQNITVTINNEPLAFTNTDRPIMNHERVMVPLRAVTEKLGGNVLYDASTQVITGAQPSNGNQFRIRVGSGEALLNGKQMVLDSPPQVVNGVTYVPLRFVSEALGAKVAWQPAHRAVIINVNGSQVSAITKP